MHRDIELREATMAQTRQKRAVGRRVDQERRHGREEGHFRFSLGTVFEWYDFICTRPRAILRGAILPAWERHRGATFGLCDLCGGLPGAPLRCDRVRSVGDLRVGSTPSWSRSYHGGATFWSFAADLQDDSLGGTGLLVLLRLVQGSGHSAASTAARRLRRRACRKVSAATTSWIQTTALGFSSRSG